jgi:GLPGLI family protein
MKKITLAVTLFFCFSITQCFAQFEGKIQFDSYKVTSGHKKKDGASVLYITPKRLFLHSNNSYKIGGTMKTDGIMVRNEKKDFVFFTGNNKAFKITKAGITTFMNMFGNSADVKKASANISYKKTGKTKKVDGYKCEQFIFTDKKNPDEHSEIWMTKALAVNWGILAEAWDKNLKNFADNNFPLDLVFKKGYFLIQWKEYKHKKLTNVTQAHVTATKDVQSKVKIPANVQILSLQQYLFQQMRRQH